MQTKITFLALIFSVFSFGQAGTIFTAGGIKYKITGATMVEVTQNPTTLAGTITLPESVSYNSANYQLTTIGDRAFFYCSGIKALTIPSSVTSIGLNAFYFCTGLTSFTIPNSVKTIGEGAFRLCSGLTSVVIPNSVTSIGKGAFSSCVSLSSINIPNLMPSLSQGLFSGCYALTSITIPNSVTSIGALAFESCTNLAAVSIPNTVASIGASSFKSCSSLTSVTIPDSVASIGDMAFADCFVLNVVTVKNTNTININRNVFDNLNLSDLSLNVPIGTELIYKTALVWKDFYSISASDSASIKVGQTFAVNGINYFVRKATLPYEVALANTKTIVGAATIPDMVSNDGNSFAVTSIGNSGFKDCIGLTSVTIPNTITSIGAAAFSGCASLTSVTMPKTVTSISANLFYNCTSLTSFTMPDSIKSIGVRAFSGCKELTFMLIPNAVTSMGDFSFDTCSGLTSLTVNWSIPLSITTNVFSNIDFTSVTLNVPVGTETAYKSALVWRDFIPAVKDPPILGLSFKVNGINYYVTKVTLPYEAEVGKNQYFTGSTATIPDKVLYLGNLFAVTAVSDNAFHSCSGLITVTLPNTVRYIGDWAFRVCSNLKSINIPNSTISIGRNTFNECTSLTNLTIANSVKSIGYGAFSSCNSLKSVIIPDSVTSIGDFAFANSGLTSVKISNLLTSLNEGVFYYCGAITSVAIPASVTSIGTTAFQSCIGLTSLTIPNSLKTIGLRAFESCTGLKSITFPDSVSTIGYEAFAGCTSLTSVKVAWTTPLLLSENTYSFGGINLSKVTLNVPQGTEVAYKSATVWRDFGSFTTLATNNFSVNTPVQFYPNPTQSQINFSQEINTLEVFDIAGKKVKSFQNPSTNYDVSTLQKGVYILNGKTTDGKSINEKLVKK